MISVPLWLVASVISSSVLLGFGAGVFTINFMSKKECCAFRESFQAELTELRNKVDTKISQIFDRIEDLRVELAKHARA